MTSAQNRAPWQDVDCEVRSDKLTRQLYATDASLHQIEPAAVAFPRHSGQARAVILAANGAGVPMAPRGAGTGLVGGALSQGLVIDFSRFNRTISELDLEQRTVRVGAGVVLDDLNAFLKPYGFCFGPDVATSSRATLGGMIANNSSGSHVPIYGTTADHVRALEVVLADGRLETLGLGKNGGEFARRQLEPLVLAHRKLIEQRMPGDLLKRWPGYGIDRFLRDPANLSHLLAGSEGTLAAIVSAELRIVPLPKERGVGLIFFASVAEAMQATVELLDLKPAAIEHIDSVLTDQTKGQLAFRAARALLELDTRPCPSILIVEFFEHAREKLEALAAKRLGLRTLLLRDATQAGLVWALRKAGVALLTGCKGDAKPVTGIEDTAVRPAQLPAFVAGLQSILRPLQLDACFYGHAASGLLHVRPVLDLHREDGKRIFRQVMEEVAALVTQFKGSIAAEHGVGLARTEFLPGQLGQELLHLMRAVKDTFDPLARFNPGKIIGDGRYRCDRDWRTELHQRPLPFVPRLGYAAKDESFLPHLEQCNGCGGCRKSGPTMCPTYIATGEEVMSTRGRANLIRAVLAAPASAPNASPNGLGWPELMEAMENCLGCKACATECPSNVNLALLKAELTHAWRAREGSTWRQRLLGSVDWLGRLGCFAPGLANDALRWPWLRRQLARRLGLAVERPLPPFADERFDHWFANRIDVASAAPNGSRGRVLLWDDTFVRYHEPHIGRAAVAVLESAGFAVDLLRGRRCCGRPAFSQGDLERAAHLGTHNLALLRSMERETPILFLEPSCFSMFIDDYRELNLPGAAEVAARCFLFEEFLEAEWRKNGELLAPTPRSERVVIHAHCHAKGLRNPGFMLRLAQQVPGPTAALLDTGCCGMAGAFGMLESKYALSRQIAAPLLTQLRAQPANTVVLASGTSCRHQIEHLTGTRALHMAEWLARAVRT
jgi:FAD/FMN-containing dehydrogenase/Fe-S oxidoreductase